MTVLNRQRSERVPRQALAGFLRRLAEELPAASKDSVALALVSDRKMRELNRRYRGMDSATDVLSFADDDAPAGERHLGDIVISVTSESASWITRSST